MTTIADEKLYEAETHIQIAIDALSQIVVHKCQGHDDYNAEHQAKIQDVFIKLLAIRAELE